MPFVWVPNKCRKCGKIIKDDGSYYSHPTRCPECCKHPKSKVIGVPPGDNYCTACDTFVG